MVKMDFWFLPPEIRPGGLQGRAPRVPGGFFQGSLKVLKRWWVSTKQAFFGLWMNSKQRCWGWTLWAGVMDFKRRRFSLDSTDDSKF